MRRRYVAWIALGIAAAAVVAYLVLREETVEPTTSFTEPASPPDVEVEREREPENEREAEATAPETGVDPEVPSDIVGCDHPLIAAERAQARVYRWTQSDQDRVAELRIRPRQTRERTDGDRVVVWSIDVTAEDDDSSLGQASLETRCTPGEGAEEPWFGILERSLGLQPTGEPGRWRWPASLEEGATFEGAATFDPEGSDMQRPDDVVGPQVLRVSRSHRVEGRERVRVPAGAFEAWRVTYEERHDFGPRGETGTGTQWVAEGIGLVKLEAVNSAGVTQTIELLRGAR